MNRNIIFALLLSSLLTAVAATQAETWPGWRGPRSDGTSIEKNVTTNWDPAVAVWKTKLPGKGHASPIVWGDYVCTTAGIEDSTERVLLCLDRNSGKIIWQQTVVKGPLQKLHKENSYASGTPVTDGKRVFVVFRVGDNMIAAAHDLATGKQIWKVQMGTHKGMWGYSNSPVLFKDKVIIDCDGEDENSFLIALSRADGKTLWRNDRSNKGPSYSAPFIREISGKIQMIQCGDRGVSSFDPDSGKQLWTVDGPSEQFVGTPVYSEKAGLIFASSSWPKRKLLAIRPNGKGNVTETHVAWSDTKGAPYTPSMIVAGDFLISTHRGGNAFCYEAATGEILWKEKLGRHHASPVLIDGLAFFINDDGQVNVIKPGKTFERVASYEMGESVYGSPAISDGQVFVRGFDHLFCFGKQVKPATGEFFDNAAKGNVQAVEKALVGGADANSQNSEKRTALMFAAFDGHISTVEILLTHGADVNLKDSIGRNALMYAATGSNNSTVKLLLQKGADVNVADGNEQWTALMYAAAEGQIEVVRTLLGNKADWAMKDTDGDTARSFAIKNGHSKVVELIDNFVKAKTGPN